MQGVMFLLFPLLVGLILYYSFVDARAFKKRRRFVFHADGKSDAEITAELKQQFAPTKEWC